MKQPKEPRKQPRQPRAVQTVEAILEAAARILEQGGFEAATTNAIARVAGVSVGSLYQYFPDKHALVTALHERHTAQVLCRLEQVHEASAGASLELLIDRLVAALLEEHLTRPRLQRILHAEFALLAHPSDQSPAARAIFQRVKAILSTHYAERKPSDLEVAAHILLKTAETLIHAVVLEPPNDVDARRLEREIADVLTRYMRGTRADPRPPARRGPGAPGSPARRDGLRRQRRRGARRPRPRRGCRL